MDLRALAGERGGPVRRVGLWVALLLPALAWGSLELGLTTLVRLSCDAAGSWIGIAVGIFGLALCGLAATIAWSHIRRGDDSVASRQWLARLAPVGAGIFALAIAFQTLAAWIVPPCVR